MMMLEPSGIGCAAVFFAAMCGSLHCVGMCGGFVALYSSGKDGSAVTPHLAYNTGRLITYSVLGALAGAMGHTIDSAGRMAGIQHAASAAVGVLLILWGAQMLFGVRVLPRTGRLSVLSAALSAALRARETLSPAAFAGLLGLLSAVLPCGFLYGFVIVAAGTGTAWKGAAVMSMFWAGTLPALSIFGGAARYLSRRMLSILPRFAAVLILAAGLYSLGWHINSARKAGECPHASAAGGGAQSSARGVP